MLVGCVAPMPRCMPTMGTGAVDKSLAWVEMAPLHRCSWLQDDRSAPTAEMGATHLFAEEVRPEEQTINATAASAAPAVAKAMGRAVLGAQCSSEASSSRIVCGPSGFE